MKKKLFLLFEIAVLLETCPAMLNINEISQRDVHMEPADTMFSLSRLSIAPKIENKKMQNSTEIKLYSDDELEKNITLSYINTILPPISFKDFLYIGRTSVLPAWVNDKYMMGIGEKNLKASSLIYAFSALASLFVREIERNLVKSNGSEALKRLYYCPDGIQRTWGTMRLIFKELSQRFFEYIYDIFKGTIGLNEMICGAILSGRVVGKNEKLWNVPLASWQKFGGFGSSIDNTLISCMMLSNKFNAEITYNNKCWSSVTGLSMAELHDIEIECLIKRLNGRCWIKEKKVLDAQKFLIQRTRDLSDAMQRQIKLESQYRSN